MNHPHDVTNALLEVSGGQPGAMGRLIPLVYEELRRLADRWIQEEPVGHTWQPTDLVHEAYVRIVNQDRVCWKDRAHFFAISSMVIRRVLVGHARARNAEKRGRGLRGRTLATAARLSKESGLHPVDVLALHEVLESLAKQSPRRAELVTLRYFGGLSVKEAAEVMGISESTAKEHWKFARAWLVSRLKETTG